MTSKRLSNQSSAQRVSFTPERTCLCLRTETSVSEEQLLLTLLPRFHNKTSEIMCFNAVTVTCKDTPWPSEDKHVDTVCL